MAREIVLDTETTGFDPKTGDRLIEVGCIEIEDLLPTGRTFHRLVNPERLIPPGPIAVPGLTDGKVGGIAMHIGARVAAEAGLVGYDNSEDQPVLEPGTGQNTAAACSPMSFAIWACVKPSCARCAASFSASNCTARSARTVVTSCSAALDAGVAFALPRCTCLSSACTCLRSRLSAAISVRCAELALRKA